MPAKKKELIEWLKHLQNDALIEEIYSVKSAYADFERATRKFGCGKELVGEVSADFNDPLDVFSSYTK